MKNKKTGSAKVRYTVAGVLLGGIFPAAYFLLPRFLPDQPLVLTLVICLAPLCLVLFAWLTGQKKDSLLADHHTLEKEAEERTNAILGLMDVSGLGILSFSADLSINPEYSRECEKIFGGPIAGKQIQDLLFINPSIRDEFKEGMLLFFSGKSKSQVIFDLTEKETVINSQFYQLDFREINAENILCVLTNVTSQRRLEEKIEHETEERTILLRAVSHKNYFGSFIKEAAKIFETIDLLAERPHKNKEALEELQRDLHTFKGNAGFFGFSNTEEVAYDFEYYISDMMTLEEDIELKEITQDLKKSYYNELHVIKKTLGQQWLDETDSVLVPREQYLRIERYIKLKLKDDRKFCKLIERFRKVPIRDLFARFPAMTERLAASLGKKINPLAITGGDFLVLPERYEPLVNTFVHIIRNMVDHGIEPPADREILQKPRAGNISIDIQSVPEGISIRLTDDGRGISLSSLKEKAIELKLIEAQANPAEKELLEMLFVQSLSTAENVTNVSGWGVGLAAVKKAVERYKGRINVKTGMNSGTSFEIILPLQKRSKIK